MGISSHVKSTLIAGVIFSPSKHTKLWHTCTAIKTLCLDGTQHNDSGRQCKTLNFQPALPPHESGISSLQIFYALHGSVIYILQTGPYFCSIKVLETFTIKISH